MCKNKNCFELSHLELGTFKQNNYDDKIRDNTLLIGVKHPNCTIKTFKISINPSFKTGAQRVKQFNV